MWPQIIYGDGGQSGFNVTNSTLRFNTFSGQGNAANFRNGDPSTGSTSQGRILTVRRGRISTRRSFRIQILPTPERFTKAPSAFGEHRTGAVSQAFSRRTATTLRSRCNTAYLWRLCPARAGGATDLTDHIRSQSTVPIVVAVLLPGSHGRPVIPERFGPERGPGVSS